MPPHHNSSALQALYRVFVFPALSSSSCAIPVRALLQRAPRRHLAFRSRFPLQVAPAARRAFSTTPSRQAKTRAPETRAQKWDDEIRARLIYLVDPATQLREEEPRTRYDVLNSLDRTTHRLVQLTPDEPGNRDFVPTCKVVSKKEQYDMDRKRSVQAKERRMEAKKGRSVKTVELNWAIDGNDLQHRLDRVEEFLGEGRRVEVVLAAKKRGRKATTAECEELLRKIYGVVDKVEGAKEFKRFEGKLGGFATLTLQGKAAGQGQARDEDGGDG